MDDYEEFMATLDAFRRFDKGVVSDIAQLFGHNGIVQNDLRIQDELDDMYHHIKEFDIIVRRLQNK